MAIKKQEFYEGAALHLLARTGGIKSIRYDAPFFLLNNQLLVYLKYSTKGRSPWGFTFMPNEQVLLQSRASEFKIVIGLILAGGEFTNVPRDKIALYILRTKADRQKNAAWWPQIRFPDGRYAFAFAV